MPKPGRVGELAELARVKDRLGPESNPSAGHGRALAFLVYLLGRARDFLQEPLGIASKRQQIQYAQPAGAWSKAAKPRVTGRSTASLLDWAWREAQCWQRRHETSRLRQA